MEKMLLTELGGAWMGAHVQDDRMYTIRGNYGVGTVASMFGCEISFTQDSGMPWCHHLNDEQLDKILEAGTIDVNTGLVGRAADTVRFYRNALSGFEKLAKHVHIFVCDTQGPFDIAHLIMGPRIYTEVYDNPERVHRLLDLATEAYIRVTRDQKRLIGEANDWSYHSQMLSRGGVRICEDTPTNLSRDTYLEFCRPYNERILREFDGGWVHYCGSGKQIMGEILSTPGVKGINFGNPEMQDIGAVHEAASPHKIPILGFVRDAPPPDHIGTGVTLVARAPDIEAATAMLGRR